MTRSLAIVCGLKSEAAVIGKALAALNAGERAGVWISGANAQQAEEMARTAIEEDAVAAVLSIGISGALSPDLAPGDLLIAASVRTAHGEEFACDRDLTAIWSATIRQPAHPGVSRDPESRAGGAGFEAVAGLGPGFRRDERGGGARTIQHAVLLGSDVIVASAAEKERLLHATGAVAVDMESHGAARAAKAKGVPFLAIRAIADPAHRALPKSALGAVAPDGSMKIAATLMRVAAAPWEFPALLQLGSDSDRALKALGGSLDGLFRGLFLGLDL